MEPNQPEPLCRLETNRGPAMGARTLLALAALQLSGLAWPAQQDICENKSGSELIRCIEAAARAAPGPTTPPPAGSAPAASVPAQKLQPPPARDAIQTPAEDCTGKTGDMLRRCLAAGGRLSPAAAVLGTQASDKPAAVTRIESCDAKSGEDLRRCIEAAAKAPQTTRPAATRPAAAQPQIISCTGYTSADQPLCVHRNMALAECRNRQKYPDLDVCLRSYMTRSPEPAQADCSKLQARSRTHCDARNQVFQSCAGDKLGYFTCLENRLGPDALLTRR